MTDAAAEAGEGPEKSGKQRAHGYQSSEFEGVHLRKSFENACRAHTATNAHGDHAIARVLTL